MTLDNSRRDSSWLEGEVKSCQTRTKEKRRAEETKINCEFFFFGKCCCSIFEYQMTSLLWVHISLLSSKNKDRNKTKEKKPSHSSIFAIQILRWKRRHFLCGHVCVCVLEMRTPKIFSFGVKFIGKNTVIMNDKQICCGSLYVCVCASGLLQESHCRSGCHQV